MNTQDRAASYVDAFYEAALERWLRTLDLVASGLAKDPPLIDRLQASEVEFPQRQAVLDRMLPGETDPLVRNLLYTLLQRADLELLPEISAGLRRRVERGEEALLPVDVVSALPLDEAQRQALLGKLQAQYGTRLDLHYRVDPAILGGLIVRVGDKLMDGSVATRMAALRQSLGLATTEQRRDE
jgi:F-type H+-transporting ATPase subunit delta